MRIKKLIKIFVFLDFCMATYRNFKFARESSALQFSAQFVLTITAGVYFYLVREPTNTWYGIKIFISLSSTTTAVAISLINLKFCRKDFLLVFFYSKYSNTSKLRFMKKINSRKNLAHEWEAAKGSINPKSKNSK